MVDVKKEERILIEDDPLLRRGVDLIGGEARFRHLYTQTPHDVFHRWQERLEDNVVVMTREQGIDEGLFGVVKNSFLHRIGDVIAIPRSGQAYLTSTFPGEHYLVGMHGAATSEENYVPLFID
jgi:hypothetical protein